MKNFKFRQYMGNSHRKVTFGDLLHIKMQHNSSRKLPKAVTKEVKQKMRLLSNVYVDEPNMSKSARQKRNKHLKELGLWSVWNNLYSAANGAPTRRRQRKMQNSTPKDKAAVETHFDNNWSTEEKYVNNSSYQHVGGTISNENSSTPQLNYPKEIGIVKNHTVCNTRDITNQTIQPFHCGFNDFGVKKPIEGTARYLLQITIIPQGYPNVLLTEDQAEMIRNAVLAKIDTLTPGTIGPKFTGIDMIDGAVVVFCLDKYSRRWLEQLITVHSLEGNIKLTILKKVTAVIWISGPCDDPEVILKRLQLQNETLFTESWTILERNVGDMGQELIVSMGESEWRKIEDIDCMPHLNFSRVLFTVLQEEMW